MNRRDHLEAAAPGAVPLSSPRRSVTKADSIPDPTHGAFGKKFWPLMNELNMELTA